MMGYKDKTWCQDKLCAKWEGCDRAFTTQVDKDATAWWGDPNYPIVVFALERGVHADCYSPPATEVH